MKKVYLVGIQYDDFAEGGFAIVFATANEEKAIQVLEEKRKNVVGPVYGYTPVFGLAILTLNEKNEEKVIQMLDI